MIIRVIVDIFILLSCFFAFAGTVGIIRMPDSYCRMQSSTNIATLGVLGVTIGGFIYELYLGNIGFALKILGIGLFVILTNPISGHAICKAAYKYGVRPKDKMTFDAYGRDGFDE